MISIMHYSHNSKIPLHTFLARISVNYLIFHKESEYFLDKDIAYFGTYSIKYSISQK